MNAGQNDLIEKLKRYFVLANLKSNNIDSLFDKLKNIKINEFIELAENIRKVISQQIAILAYEEKNLSLTNEEKSASNHDTIMHHSFFHEIVSKIAGKHDINTTIEDLIECLKKQNYNISSAIDNAKSGKGNNISEFLKKFAAEVGSEIKTINKYIKFDDLKKKLATKKPSAVQTKVNPAIQNIIPFLKNPYCLIGLMSNIGGMMKDYGNAPSGGSGQATRWITDNVKNFPGTLKFWEREILSITNKVHNKVNKVKDGKILELIDFKYGPSCISKTQDNRQTGYFTFVAGRGSDHMGRPGDSCFAVIYPYTAQNINYINPILANEKIRELVKAMVVLYFANIGDRQYADARDYLHLQSKIESSRDIILANQLDKSYPDFFKKVTNYLHPPERKKTAQLPKFQNEARWG